VFCLFRLEDRAVEELLKNNIWPDIFDKYATLLRLGREAGRSVRFLDPMDSGLGRTIADLARETPGIRLSEIAELLNIGIALAAKLAGEIVQKEALRISFDL
jgi:hypothetical protein